MAQEKQGWFAGLRAKARVIKQDTYALYFAYRNPRVPWYAKLVAALVVAYAFSPIDLIPDFVPVLGYLDDVILIPLGIALAVRMIPADVMAEARESAREHLSQDRPVNWVAAVVIILVWVLVLLWIGSLIIETKSSGLRIKYS